MINGEAADTAIKYDEPFRAFRFIVEVENPQSGEGAKVAAFSQFSGIKMRIDTFEHRFGNESRGAFSNVPGLAHYENVTLSRGVIGDNDFMEWIYTVSPTENDAPTLKNRYRNINIIALDDKGKRAITWTLYNAIPVAYELSPFDGSQSDLLSESIEFAFNGFKRSVKEPA